MSKLEERTTLHRVRQAGIRVLVATLGGGLSFLASLALLLSTQGWQNAFWNVAVWLQAPLVTAAGFAAGLALGNHVTGYRKDSFWRLYLWTLIGCSLGAAVVYPFGPMLIVFGMLAAGVASVVLHEALGEHWLGRSSSRRTFGGE